MRNSMINWIGLTMLVVPSVALLIVLAFENWIIVALSIMVSIYVLFALHLINRN